MNIILMVFLIYIMQTCRDIKYIKDNWSNCNLVLGVINDKEGKS